MTKKRDWGLWPAYLMVLVVFLLLFYVVSSRSEEEEADIAGRGQIDLPAHDLGHLQDPAFLSGTDWTLFVQAGLADTALRSVMGIATAPNTTVSGFASLDACRTAAAGVMRTMLSTQTPFSEISGSAACLNMDTGQSAGFTLDEVLNN